MYVKQMQLVQTHQSIWRKFTILCQLYKDNFSPLDIFGNEGNGKKSENTSIYFSETIRKNRIKSIQYFIKQLTIVKIIFTIDTPNKNHHPWDVLQKS